MTQLSPQPRFTAELRRTRPAASVVGAEHEEHCSPHCDCAALHRDVLQAIGDLRRTVEDAAAQTPRLPAAPERPVLAGPQVAPVALPAEAAPGADQLLCELRALENAIMETKREIAALRQIGKPPATIATATNELDAVVEATETATECILAASERIDEVTTRLRGTATGAEQTAAIEDIGEQVTRIFESCNFQDITGQRITKVVGAMKFIEERVERMIEILGGSAAFATLDAGPEAEPAKPADDESHLLCGPQLDEHKISQDDIDRFFS